MNKTKTTIIIAWRFNKRNCYDKYDRVLISTDYEIIKFFVPADKDEQLSRDLFNELKKLVFEIRTPLFVFIHAPNFRDFHEELLALNKLKQNIYINFFEGGTECVYEMLINQEENDLKKIDENSIEEVIVEIEKVYGLKAKLNVALMFLHNFLKNAKVNQSLPVEFKNCDSLFKPFMEEKNDHNLRKLRDAIFEQVGL